MGVTVRDIAKRLNIGKSTVGYALNGGPKPVSDEVRRLVLEAAKEMGYRPNENARSLAKGQTNMIGIVPFQLQKGALASPFIRTALGAIYDAAEDLGRHIVLFTGYDPQDPDTMRSRFFEARVDGVVLIAPKIDQEMLSYIAEQNLPLAVIASPAPDIGLQFNADNAMGVRRAVDHLVELGHRRIGVISGRQGSGDAQERHDAFLEGMASHGLPVAPEHIQFGNFDVQSGYEAALKMLSAGNRPTAVFAGNDQMAFGLYRAAQQLGIEIPRDLSVIGFDDDELSEHMTPGLTTVRQPVAEMAEAALKAVVQLAQGELISEQIFDTRLIVRASTASPKEDPSSCSEKHLPS